MAETPSSPAALSRWDTFADLYIPIHMEHSGTCGSHGLSEETAALFPLLLPRTRSATPPLYGGCAGEGVNVGVGWVTTEEVPSRSSG